MKVRVSKRVPDQDNFLHSWYLETFFQLLKDIDENHQMYALD